MHLGWASVELNIARILWAFDVEPVKGKDGKDIDVDMSVSRVPMSLLWAIVRRLRIPGPTRCSANTGQFCLF